MKLARADVLKRESYVSQLFRDNPNLSIRKAQTLIIGKFGKQMRPGRILEIRRGVLVGNHAPDIDVTQKPE